MCLGGRAFRGLEEGDPRGPYPVITTSGPRAPRQGGRHPFTPATSPEPPPRPAPDGVELSPPGLQKEELASKNPKRANEASRLPLGQPLMGPEKRASSTSNNEHEGESQTGILAPTRNPPTVQMTKSL